MKISPIMNPNILESYKASKPAPARPKTAGGRDEVIFSEEALSFSKALADARDAIELRTAEEKVHIADIAQAVRQGVYRVDSDKIADSILRASRSE